MSHCPRSVHAILLCQLKIKNMFQRRFLITEIRGEVKNRMLEIPVQRGSLILGCAKRVIQGGGGECSIAKEEGVVFLLLFCMLLENVGGFLGGYGAV